MTDVWTPAGDCAPAPAATALGGPAPHWQSYTYTAAGNRDTDTRHDPPGKTVGTSPAPTATTRTARAAEHTDVGLLDGSRHPQGHLRLRARRRHGVPHTERRGEAGVRRTFQGNLASVTEGSATTQYLYDADGKRLISRDPGGVSTLYLGATEITWTKPRGRRPHGGTTTSAARAPCARTTARSPSSSPTRTAPVNSQSTLPPRPWCSAAPCPSARSAARCRRPEAGQRLEKIIKELYIRPQVADKDVVGDGKTASALIEEVNEGKSFGGDGSKWHIEKTVDKLGGLRDLLEDDRKAKEDTGKGILSDSDRKVALNESKELWTALNADDVAGAVTKRVKASGYDKTVSKLKGRGFAKAFGWWAAPPASRSSRWTSTTRASGRRRNGSASPLRTR